MTSQPKETVRAHVDRRSNPRLATRIQAVIEDTEHGSLVFTASGFSRTGAFLKPRDYHAQLPRSGSVVQLVFHWPLETHIPPVRVEATVIHQNEQGLGVKFEIA